MTKSELNSLRQEIERIDARIVELLAQRQQASVEIGLVKQKSGLPVKDRRREAVVKKAFAARSRSLGYDPEIAVKIAELLMTDSVTIQKRRAERDLSGKRALVVGGSGRMGAWLCRRLSNRGASVSIWDPRGRLEGYESVKSPEIAARNSDIVVVASPLGVALAELDKVLKSKPRGLVFDVCSVKSHVANRLRSAARSGIKVASVHPMFGPSVTTPKGRTVIVCNCGSREGAASAERLLKSAGANVVRMPIERHDKLMAYVLGLPHLAPMLFATTLSRSGIPLADLKRVQGPSFERMLAASTELHKESVRVYHDIQALNPGTREMFANFVNSVKLFREAAIQKDSTEFRKLMDRNRKYLEVK